MPKRKKSPKKAILPLDTTSEKKPRGRPGVRVSEVTGRGDHYRLVFGQIWDAVGERLLEAQTEADVLKAFDPVPFYKQEFGNLAGLILKVLHDPKFPKRREPQINFLADSLAARGRVSPRRSRDICDRERKRKVNYIIRRDYYIECTCRYKGPALHGKCPKCGTGELYLPYSEFDS